MGKAIISSLVKSSLTRPDMVSDLRWIGAATTATASWDERVSTAEGIGIGTLERVWVDRPSLLQIDVNTILGTSPGGKLTMNNEAFDLNQYLKDKIGTQGFFAPAADQAVLNNITLSFTAGQVMTASFQNMIYKPTKGLIEFFDTYPSEADIPAGSGTELLPLSTEEAAVRVVYNQGDELIEGLSAFQVQAPLQFAPIESIYRMNYLVPKLPPVVNLTLTLMNDFFTDRKEIFTDLHQLDSLRVWKFTFKAPKIINVEQSNDAQGFRSWNVTLQAKNLIKES